MSDNPDEHCKMEILRKLKDDTNDDANIVIKMPDKVMFRVQGYILAWDGNTAGLVW